MGERTAPMGVACLLAVGALLTGCRKEPAEPTWDVDVVAPLVVTSMSIADLIPDSLLTVDDNGNVSVLYTTELFSLSLDTVLTAPDTSFRYTYVLPFPGPVEIAAGTTLNTDNDVTEFELDGLELRGLKVRSGTVDIAITNMMQATIVGTFGLPGATLGGAPFSVVQTVPPGTPAAPSSLTTTRALDGYVFNMSGPSFNTVNTLATALTYATHPDAGIAIVTDDDSLIAEVSYRDIVPEYATGYFGTRTIEVGADTTALDLFEGITGLLDLDQVTARLRIRNGVGVDARAQVHYIRSLNTTTGSTVDLLHPITSSPVNLDRALDLGNGFQPAENTFTLTEANSNIDAFVENLPDRLAYALDLTIDPLGDISNGHDFLYHDSRITSQLEVDIPLRLNANGLSLQKYMDVDLPGNAEAHAIRSGTLHLFATNGFPFRADLHVAIVDATDAVVAELGPAGTVASGTVGGNGLVTAPVASQIALDLSEAEMDLLHTHGRLRIRAVFTTTGTGHVQLLDRYRLDIQLTAEGNYLVNGDE